jgi:hypothetical protein
MRTGLVIALLVAVSTLGGAASTPRPLSNDHFNIQVGPEGITSLKRPNDAYDTDYIAEGAALGRLEIRYRRLPDSEWRTANIVTVKDGTPERKSAPGVSYVVGELKPTIASTSKVSASEGRRGLEAVNDQIEPQNSADWQSTAFVWRVRDATEEWLQYDFAKPETVSHVSIYWFETESGRFVCKTPKSWRLLYQDGAEWKEVAKPSGYGIDKDTFNKVTFEPVLTSGLRMEAKFQDGTSAGVLEWRVNTDEGRTVEPLNDLGLSGRFSLEGDALVWSIRLENRSDQAIEIGDLGLPLQFNTRYGWDKSETYTKRVLRHSFVSGHGSFIYWMRTNGEGPYLVMVPSGKTQLEYFGPPYWGGYCPYIHSAATAAEAREKGGTWRQPNTSRRPDGLRVSVPLGKRLRWRPESPLQRTQVRRQRGPRNDGSERSLCALLPTYQEQDYLHRR